jgi:hypothetical protein
MISETPQYMTFKLGDELWTSGAFELWLAYGRKRWTGVGMARWGMLGSIRTSPMTVGLPHGRADGRFSSRSKAIVY